jgi:tripartite-type tricarboxylate transporter receptor subunit TctC
VNSVVRILLPALLVALAGCAQEREPAAYPSGTIRIVVPYPPGGFNDTFARAAAQKLHDTWGQPVIVENRAGGNTTIGTGHVARAPADGHTLLIVSFAFAANPGLYDNLPYDALEDLAPVILAAGTANVLVTRPDLPVESVQELIALARERPGTLNYASAGNGSSNHLSMELFKSLTGTDFVHVPYRGSAPAVADLLGGQVDVMFDNTPNVMPHVRIGRLRALAVSTRARSRFTPELPTVEESGVPGFDVPVWFGVVAPAGTPQPVIGQLNATFNRLLRMPDVLQLLEQQGVEPRGGTPEEFDAFLRAQIETWAAVAKASGARPE